MLTLLRIARKRSIKVNIYIPEKSDSVILDMANRSCMDSLQELDIQIHFIQPPFMHAKIQIFDQQCIILGTSNFDIRSFKLNFETSLVLKSDYFSQEVNKFTQEIISHSRPARDSLPQKNPFIRKLTDALVQIASPLL
jgi:cardiolipin synthase